MTYRKLSVLLTIVWLLGSSESAFGDPFPTVSSFEEFQELTHNQPAFLLVSRPGCKGFSATLTRLVKHQSKFRGYPLYVWASDDRSPLPNTPFNKLVSPMLNFFDGGKRLDVLYGWRGQDGAESRFLIDFLNRTVGDKSRKFVTWRDADFESRPDKTLVFLRMLARSPCYPYDLEKEDFSGIKLDAYTAFTGGNLRNSDFSGATLNRVAFSGADLTGANFSEAKLTNIFWGDCICPDGTRSSDHDLSCEKNLTK